MLNPVTICGIEPGDNTVTPIHATNDGELLVAVSGGVVSGDQGDTSEAVIANGESLSDAIDLGSARLGGLYLGAGWTAADLTFQASFDGINFFDLYDASGAEVTVDADESRAIALDAALFRPFRRLKLRSGTAAAAVAQAAERTITLALVQ